MRRFVSATIAAGIILAAGVIARAETWSLELKPLDAKSRSLGAMRTLFYQIDQKPGRMQIPGVEVQGKAEAALFKRIVKKEPTYESKNPLHGVVKLGSRDYAFALDIVAPKPPDSALEKLDKKLTDALAPSRPTYNRLYFDANCNGDLTDEGVLEGVTPTGMPQSGRFQFPQINLAIDIEGVKLDYPFILGGAAMYAPGGFSYVTVTFNSAICREGDITLGEKKHHVVLIDFNCNGRFDDMLKVGQQLPGKPAPLEPGDVLLVDTTMRNVNGRGTLFTPASSNQLLVSKHVALDGRFYDMQVSPAGDRLTLTATERLGQLSNPPDGFRGMIFNDTSLLRINGKKGEPMPVPEGQWKLLSYEIDQTGYKPEEKDKEEGADLLGMANPPKPITGGMRGGNRTIIMATSAAGKCKPFEVRAGETMEMPFGPPFKALVTAGAKGPNVENLPLALAFVGRGGEQVNNLLVNGQKPAKPKFTITDPDGKVVQEGSFEYG